MKKNLSKFEAYLIPPKGLKQILGGYNGGGSYAGCRLNCPNGTTISVSGKKQCNTNGLCCIQYVEWSSTETKETCCA